MHRLLHTIFPEQASNFAPQVDYLFFALLALCSAVTLLVFAAILFFCVRYRRGSQVDRGPRKFSSLRFEISWTVIPFFIFLGLFFWAADVFFGMSRPPANATEIYVVGKQWMWKIQHPDGRREINALHIPVGQPVKLIMTSQDVIHDFFIPGFRTKQDVVPGRYTTEWFTPTRPGQYHLFCSQYCGMDHSKMIGTIYVMEPAEHARWLAEQPAPDSLVAIGERSFHTRGCSGCHAPNAALRAPLLDGIYGKKIPLADSTLVTADEEYLRDSILLPNKQIAAGYEAIMPTFQGQISEEELNAIIAYLKSLGASNGNGERP
ncbi:MAG: cytochrome c oxidase subunit II [Verrucomicrobiota bacterium]|nr:cytochrome c oxidase subunit II [Verrucomicrobiota bacterium]MDQ6939758.1 cytochrome c oxidase subunit II [Verrucomicrobiota bacterium]